MNQTDNVVHSDLFNVDPATGKTQLYLHPGQARAWDSTRRIIAVLAGNQSGKTSWGPWWLYREIQHTADPRGSNDYLCVTATFPLLRLKMLPEFIRVFQTTLKLGRWYAADKIFELANPRNGALANRSTEPMWGRVIFGSAMNANSLESATAKAAWCDEAGMNSFRVDAWEAVQRRVGLNRGRTLITTTLYNSGWLKQNLYDPWKRGERDDIDVIQFKSKDNPMFPIEEYHRAMRDLPKWKFSMQYEGEYDRPAGMIYDCFDAELQVIPPIALDPLWPIYVGVDFGGVNMAALFTAENPETHDLYHFHEYLMGGKSIKQHAEAFRKIAGMRPLRWIGGAKPEDQWRQEFRDNGIPLIPPPISDVEVGISRVYAYHKNNQIFVFDTLKRYLDEKGSYSRKLDDSNQPTEEIEDKNTYHMMDAERVMIAQIFNLKSRVDPAVIAQSAKADMSRWEGVRSGMAYDFNRTGRWQRGRKW